MERVRQVVTKQTFQMIEENHMSFHVYDHRGIVLPIPWLHSAKYEGLDSLSSTIGGVEANISSSFWVKSSQKDFAISATRMLKKNRPQQTSPT